MSTRVLCTLLFAVLFSAGTAFGTSIPITNHSFEAQVLAENAFTVGTISGWVVTGNYAGAWNPTVQFVSIPDGVNTAYATNASITQVLSTNLMDNSLYTLRVAVGDRSDIGCCLNYSIGLFAGGNLLSQVIDPVQPGNGLFADAVVTFDSTGSSFVGQALEVRLIGINAGFGQYNFDNVRLNAESVVATPEPNTLLLLGVGIIFLSKVKRTKS